MDIYGMSASYEDHLAVPAADEPLNGKYQWIQEAIEVQELQQIANLWEKISKSISDIALQSRVLGIEGSNICNIDPPASMMGTKLLPGDTLFSNLNDFEPPDNDIDVDDEESSDEADVPMALLNSDLLCMSVFIANPDVQASAHLQIRSAIEGGMASFQGISGVALRSRMWLVIIASFQEITRVALCSKMQLIIIMTPATDCWKYLGQLPLARTGIDPGNIWGNYQAAPRSRTWLISIVTPTTNHGCIEEVSCAFRWCCGAVAEDTLRLLGSL
ncbi:hypothetical protein BDN71DRAFT_1436779 [Pleurotus eryngii]|uniref:Uncharacterized protein n=1 Tax=Pleurotus eryngii TaxID=5323 RepID=A0A9P6D8E3_PLEER|nr:hypothetical protein BDN71DRAFT_1436779 [Pleurotus eryngii]